MSLGKVSTIARSCSRLALPVAIVASLSACGSNIPTSTDLLNDPAAALHAPGSTISQTYSQPGRNNLFSKDSSSAGFAETTTSSQASVTDFYDASLHALGWTRDRGRAMSSSDDGPHSSYGWSKGKLGMNLTLFDAPAANGQVSFKAFITFENLAEAPANAASELVTPHWPC